MHPLKDQHVLILGLGASGLAMARWCARCGAQVSVADTREAPPQRAALQRDVPQARFLAGALEAALAELQGVAAVYASPGLSPAQIAPVLIAARARQISVAGELDLFSQALRTLQETQRYAPCILAITGTNGKTTVTALTAQIVARAGLSVRAAGNIGPTLLDTLAQCLDAAALPQVWVLELSSFQLALSHDFEPSAATVLNISQDHLDWHPSLQDYQDAKRRIFGTRALCVFNRDDPVAAALTPAQSTAALPRGRGRRSAARSLCSFGYQLPQKPGDWGVQDVHGMAWLVRAYPADASHRPHKDEAGEVHLQRLMPADALRIHGRHNVLNALAALALAQAAGCSLGPLLQALREYRGEPHRVQSVGSVHGVEYFDDSKGTNVGATVAALCGLGAAGRKLVVLLGGEGKGQDFSPLAPAVHSHARAVVLIGRDAQLIRAALRDTGVALQDAQSMEQAVQQAHALAQRGDAVLMSPACASFDMFDDYAHRARVFVAAVQALALDAACALEVRP